MAPICAVVSVGSPFALSSPPSSSPLSSSSSEDDSCRVRFPGGFFSFFCTAAGNGNCSALLSFTGVGFTCHSTS
uniref:Putative secreted protein n=1 Tax=Anopheles triannulatus TaxID=58253 RepID=A0A2M4B3I5_9DIPT